MVATLEVWAFRDNYADKPDIPCSNTSYPSCFTDPKPSALNPKTLNPKPATRSFAEGNDVTQYARVRTQPLQ